MVSKQNDIEDLIDTMILGGNEFVDNLKKSLPESLAETLEMFHETNISNLKKIKELVKNQ